MTLAPQVVLDESTLSVERRATASAARAGQATLDTRHVLAALCEGSGHVAKWLNSVIDETRRDALIRDTGASDRGRQPVENVRPDHGVHALYGTAARLAARRGEPAVAPIDLAFACSLIPGRHTEYLLEHELALLRPLREPIGEPPEPRPTPTSTHRFLDGVGVLVRAGAAGAVILFFGAGIVLRRGLAHITSMFTRRHLKFSSVWNSTEHGMHSDSTMDLRAYVRYTLGVRLLLFAVAVLTFFKIAVEIRGLGIVPWPALTSGVRTIDTSDAEISVAVEVFLGRHTMQLWIAAGAAFFAAPTAVEATRVRLWANLQSTHIVLRKLLAPVAWWGRIAGRLDLAASWLGAPVYIASGIVSLVGAMALALLLAEAVLTVAV